MPIILFEDLLNAHDRLWIEEFELMQQSKVKLDTAPINDVHANWNTPFLFFMDIFKGLIYSQWQKKA